MNTAKVNTVIKYEGKELVVKRWNYPTDCQNCYFNFNGCLNIPCLPIDRQDMDSVYFELRKVSKLHFKPRRSKNG